MSTKRVAVIISCVDAPGHAEVCTKWARLNSSQELTDVILVDNGSQQELSRYDADYLITLERNVGGNGVITMAHSIVTGPSWRGPKYDVVAFIHCDLIIREFEWDKRVLAEFDKDPLLALVGFVGSPQMDEWGGRGSGTLLNYLGDYYEGFGQCCAAEVHGTRHTGVVPIANLDHCVMIFRSEMLKQLHDVPFCPTHFYDRAMAAECNYRGWHVAYVGVSCDHFNGGTAGGVYSQDALVREWLDSQGLSYMAKQPHPVVDGTKLAQVLPTTLDRPDVVAYKESERRFWDRYRDKLRMVPFFVEPDYSHIYWSHNGRGWVPRKVRCEHCVWNAACPAHGG